LWRDDISNIKPNQRKPIFWDYFRANCIFNAPASGNNFQEIELREINRKEAERYDNCQEFETNRFYNEKLRGTLYAGFY